MLSEGSVQVKQGKTNASVERNMSCDEFVGFVEVVSWVLVR
jgi:hypothetical protein